MQIITDQITNAGGRKINEDYGGYKELKGSICWVLADGLGGHHGGETASKLAVDSILESFENKYEHIDNPEISNECLNELIDLAQNKLLEAQRKDESLSSMRTTLLVLLSNYTESLWAHIGDSRLYYFSNGQILHQTKDHSLAQLLVDSGELSIEQIRNHPDRNRLLNVLGNKDSVKPSNGVGKILLNKDDAFLICTDGFWEHIQEIEMEVDLVKSKNPEEWLYHMHNRLLGRVTDDCDNYTAIAIWII